MRFMNNSNKKYTQISIYVIITAMIIYCFSLIAKNIPTIFGEILDSLSWVLRVIKPIIIGFVFAYLLDPLVDFLEAKYKKIKILNRKEGTSRSYAVVTTILGVLFIIASIISLLVYSVTDQLRVANFDDIIVLCNEYKHIFDDFYQNITYQLTQLEIESAELSNYIKQVGSYALTTIQSIIGGVIGSITNLSSYLSTFVFALIICIYILIDGKMIKSCISKIFHALCNDKTITKIRGLVEDADLVFSGYIRGQLMDAFVMMVLISITLSVINVKFALVIGILAGIGNLIPYFGPIIAYIGTITVCLLNGQYKQLIIGVILLFIIQTIDGNVIGPRLLSHSINIHPLLVVISLIFGSAIGGLLGMLLAVPVGAFIKVVFMKYIDYRIQQKKQAMSNKNSKAEKEVKPKPAK